MKNKCTSGGRTGGLRRGFTIVEIIVVIVIIGILATLIAPRLLQRVGAAKSSTALANANTLASAINAYRIDTGAALSGSSMMFLIERPTDIDAAKWLGPYLPNKEGLVDPWGVDYVLLVPGQKNFDFDVISYGADKKPGGEGEDADVTNK